MNYARGVTTGGLLLSLVVSAAAQEPEVKKLTDAVSKLEVPVPELGGEVKFVEKVVAPRITKEFRFETKAGVAVFISTKIRPDLPKDDRVLDRVEPKFVHTQLVFGKDKVDVNFSGKSPNRVLELSILNADYNDFFPTMLSVRGGAKGLESVSVSQSYVASERMFECVVYLPNPKTLGEKELLAQARKLCTDWRTAIKIVGE